MLDGSFQSCGPAGEGPPVATESRDLCRLVSLVCSLVSLDHASFSTSGINVTIGTLLVKKCSVVILTTEYNDIDVCLPIRA